MCQECFDLIEENSPIDKPGFDVVCRDPSKSDLTVDKNYEVLNYYMDGDGKVFLITNDWGNKRYYYQDVFYEVK